MHLLQVTISCGFSLFWINNPEDVREITSDISSSSERVTNIEVRSKVKKMISQLDELKIPFLAIVTDNVPAYNAASEIFKVLSELKTTLQQALKLAVYFKNANNKYFVRKL
ncbi:hypothetical protein C1646_773540 [Rhizophagus diaphanus]|nr:hypothetical protein C1646_773540 [Rhizophagus diaphanus] [Rhizophagus sp. MUCL 43196]